MTDNDRIAELVKEYGLLKRERCCIRKELSDAGSLFGIHQQKISKILKNNHPKPQDAKFNQYLAHNELEERFHRIAEIEDRIEEIENSVPELKS